MKVGVRVEARGRLEVGGIVKAGGRLEPRGGMEAKGSGKTGGRVEAGSRQRSTKLSVP